MQFDEVKTLKDCIETATVDAYGDYEVAAGWLTCLDEMFTGVKEVQLLGEKVELIKLDLSGNDVVALCSKGKKRAKVCLDSIELISPTKVQKLWLKAWCHWYIKTNGLQAKLIQIST